ncbi:hypothetical protein Pmani_035014 [Petrolisthes manimaculis]|uniref:Uncharacterized protein n=1 Tax=Petrolisthes manimaculis TaxID=1843537 RepID=A0AAE1TQW9_9EUCA|nr:hypothetical protein Pmani_035014 [Petrolisthes manimaculis]
MKIQELQEELQNKTSELDNSTHNLKMRLTAVESANRQQGQEKNEAERQMREEKERLRQLSRKYEVVERVKGELEQKVKQFGISERQLGERTTILTIENEDLKVELQELKTKMDTKEKEWTSKLETDSKASEAKTKQRIEKMWLEKLRRSEISAAQEMERLKDSQRRAETDLRKELVLAKKAEEEAKRLNEEFKKKVRTLRQAESDATHKVSELDDEVQEMKRHQGYTGGV